MLAIAARSAAGALCLAPLAPLGSCAPAAQPLAAPQDTVVDAYTVRGERVELALRLDRIGLVRPDGAVEADHPDELDASEEDDPHDPIDLVAKIRSQDRDGLVREIEELLKGGETR